MHDPATSRIETLADWVCCGAFALALGVPLFGRALDPDADASTLPEQRTAAPLPRSPLEGVDALLAFPSGFEAWVEDHYGFRAELIRGHNLVKLFGFGTSPTDRILMGDDHWVFTTANRAIEAHVGSFELSAQDLEAWSAALEERRAWLEERGVHYLVAFAPGKPTIYPERLPAALPRAERTPLDQLHEHLRTTTAVDVVDLRGPLRAARGEPLLIETEGDWLYYRLGTHWSDRGAFVAYRELMRAIARVHPGAELPRAESYTRRRTEDPGDSWAERLRMREELVQRHVAFEPLAGHRSRVVLESASERIYERDGPGDSSLPRVVLFHDSFGDRLCDFLREGCSRLAARATVDFEPDLIEEQRPDMVIQLMAERRIATYRPPVSTLRGDGAAADRFRDAGPSRFDLDTAAGIARVSPWRRALLTPAATADEPPLVVRVRRLGDGLLLPELDLEAGEAPLLRIDVECPAPSELTILYQTPASREYQPMRRATRSLPAGRSLVHVDLGASDVVGRLLVLPGGPRGDYVFRGLEVRAAPR